MGGGDSIEELASAGPKSYAFQTRQGRKTVLKAKRITQTRESSIRVNFDSVKEMVQNDLDGEAGLSIQTPHHNITPNRNVFALRNSSFKKTFTVVYDKTVPRRHNFTIRGTDFHVCVYHPNHVFSFLGALATRLYIYILNFFACSS